jgi:predicted metal-dependent phosphoesterase TrpH
LLKADLHVHTRYSKDSVSPPEEIVQHCLKIGINCLAVTDHDSIAGALETKRIAPFKVIIGEEVLTNSGEIIGYFLKEEVPPHLSPEETVKRIKAQGGLVCIPHPCDCLRPQSRLSPRALQRILSQVDLIEVFNSRTLLSRDAVHARELAQKCGLPGTVGSDAHVIQEVGRAYIEIPEFNDAEQFRQVLVQGKIVGSRTSPLVHFYNIRNRLIKRLKRS